MLKHTLKYLPVIMILYIQGCNSYGVYDALLDAKVYNMFISSVTTQGDMSGMKLAVPACNLADPVASADCVCNSIADSAGLHTVNGSVFRAALSTTATSAICHILNLQGHVTFDEATGAYSYCDTEPALSDQFSVWENNGNMVALWESLASELSFNPMPLSGDIFDDLGVAYIGDVWTGNPVASSPLTDNCNEWTSNGSTNLGGISSTGSNANIYRTCDSSLPVYCFEFRE